MSWPLVKASDVIDVRDGTHDSPKYIESGVPLVTSKNLVKGIIDYESCQFISEEDHAAISKRSSVDNGDILYAMIGTIGNPVIVEKKFDFSIKNVALFKFNNNSILNRYVYHFLNSEVASRQLLKQSRGGTQKFISLGNLRDLKIPLPPLSEQKRIAAILDKADAIRHKRQQAIKLADDFLRSVFLEMFGDPVSNSKEWDEYVLTDVADIRSGVTKGKKIDLDSSVTLPYLRVANVQDGYLDLFEIKNIVVSESDAKKCILKKGDILLTEGGDPDKLGRGYVWNNEIEKCIHQNHIFSVRIKVSNKSLVYPEFLSALISSPRGKRYFLKVGKQTTGIATINKTVLGEFRIFIPPVELQEKYIRVKNAIKQQAKLFSKGDLNLFNSLSQRCFSGDL